MGSCSPEPGTFLDAAWAYYILGPPRISPVSSTKGPQFPRQPCLDLFLLAGSKNSLVELVKGLDFSDALPELVSLSIVLITGLCDFDVKSRPQIFFVMRYNNNKESVFLLRRPRIRDLLSFADFDGIRACSPCALWFSVALSSGFLPRFFWLPFPFLLTNFL